MTGYTKLFSSIVASTIWREDAPTRLVWITMLAMKNRDHIVEASLPGLADFARVTIKECRAAIEKLSSPDEDSRTKDFDGRRIKAIDGGWLILNGEKYRQKMNADERREYLRIKQAERRARLKGKVNNESTNVGGSYTPSTHTESESESDALIDDTLGGGDPTNLQGEIREFFRTHTVLTCNAKAEANMVKLVKTAGWPKAREYIDVAIANGAGAGNEPAYALKVAAGEQAKEKLKGKNGQRRGEPPVNTWSGRVEK
jgi:hypothetical protein